MYLIILCSSNRHAESRYLLNDSRTADESVMDFADLCGGFVNRHLCQSVHLRALLPASGLL